MKNLNKFLVAALLFFCLLFKSSYAQNITTNEITEAKKAIEASNAIYFDAFKKNDPSLFISRYAEDCLIMAPDSPAQKGRKGASDFFRFAYDKTGLRDGSFLTIDVYEIGAGCVAEEGFWKSFDKNHKLFDSGKYLVLWKKTKNGWKMFRDSFNSDGKQY